MDAAAGVFELLKPVLFHESQQALDVCKINAPDVRASAWFGFQLFRHLEFEKFPGRGGQDFGATGRYNHVVLDADAADAFDIYAWLNGQDHSLLQYRFLAFAEPGQFVDFKTQAVAQTVGEITIQSRSLEGVPCRLDRRLSGSRIPLP